MQLFAVFTILVSLLLQTVAAQDTTSFDAPPVEDANLAVSAFLLLATLVQLLLATSFLFRTRAHFVPGVAVVVTLVFAVVSYALLVVVIVDEFTVTDLGDPSVSPLSYTNLLVATYLFTSWVDALMFLAVVLILRDRYLTHTADSERPSKRIPLLPLVSLACTLVVLILVFSAARNGLYGTTLTALDNRQIGLEVANSRFDTIRNLDYTYAAFNIVAALFLVVFSVLVKKSVKSDTITSVVVYGAAPLLVLRAISSLVLLVLHNRLLSTDTNVANLDLATTATYGTLYLAVLCLLVFCLMSVRLWDGPRAHGGGSGYYQAPYLGGVQPVAPFPGQWGFAPPQPQPVPQGYPSPYVPYQVGPGHVPVQYVNNHPAQQPYVAAVPLAAGEVKTPEGVLIQNKPPPPPAS